MRIKTQSSERVSYGKRATIHGLLLLRSLDHNHCGRAGLLRIRLLLILRCWLRIRPLNRRRRLLFRSIMPVLAIISSPPRPIAGRGS